MTDKTLISIIIPIYNSEKFLEECLESVISQTYQSIEVILINDGSTDQSANICQRYAEEDCRIKFYNQENAGGAIARNNGMEVATGEFIMFVDSDDFLATDICEIVNEKMQDYDVMFFDVTSFKQTVEPNVRLSERVKKDVVDLSQYSRTEWVHSLIGEKRVITYEINFSAVWAKVYRKSFLEDHSIVFPWGVVIGEDMLFNLQVYLHEPKVCYLPVNSYFYRYNDTSVVHRYNPNFQRSDQIFLSELKKILGSKRLLDMAQEDILYQKMNGLLLTLTNDIFHVLNPKTENEKKLEFIKLISNQEKQSDYLNQLHKFGFLKRCVLFLAWKEQYHLLRFLFWIKDIAKKALKPKKNAKGQY